VLQMNCKVIAHGDKNFQNMFTQLFREGFVMCYNDRTAEQFKHCLICNHINFIHNAERIDSIERNRFELAS
jgi:hypothetical protein